MNFIKKIFLIFFLTFSVCFGGMQAYADIKINNINFDSSEGFMFLSTSLKQTSAATPAEQPPQPEISSTILKNPDRVFFDITNAVLTRPNETWYFRNSDISQIKVSQFSTNPNVVRVVFYHNQNFNPKKISVLNIKGNYLFKYGDIKLQQGDFYNSYRSEHSNSSDFLEKMVYIPASEVGKVSVNPELASINAQNIQKAFATSTGTTAQTKTPSTVSNGQPSSFDWGKVFKLRTTFFLSRVDVKRGNILILGSGRAQIEKPIFLSNPTRVVFDMPNTVVAQRFKNVEIQLTDTETLKIGQFEPSKVRLVITTNTPDKYRPIFSSDGQGLLIGHDYRMSGIKLYDKGAQTLKTTVTANDALTNTFKLQYAEPVVYSVKEADNKFELMVYNATGFNDEIFQSSIKNTKLSDTQGSKMNIGGVKYIFNLQKNSNADVQAREDGKQLKIIIKNNTSSISNKNQPVIKNDDRSGYKGCGLIILDPGHGGADTGATRAGINEKDITLEVSKMVHTILTKKGYKADLTRWDDKTLSLQDRVDISDNRLASIFVSIHVNSSVNEEPHGIETHWWTDEGYELAKVVHASFAKAIDAVDRGLVKSKFYVINHTKAKSILVEIGFISNDNERKELLTKERQQKTAESIAEGIIKFMKKEGIK